MAWSKIAVLTAILTLVFTISIFGSYFGYTVDGVPKSNIKDNYVDVYMWGIPEDDPNFVILEEGTFWKKPLVRVYKDPSTLDLIGEATEFLINLITFQIDGIPDWFSIVFIIMGLIVLYILISMFLPGGSS